MTEYQRLFLVQARSDFAVFELLRRDPNLPRCHALHYLQMSTELLAKAHAWRNPPRPYTHSGFVSFLRSLSTNRDAQDRLGLKGKNDNWMQWIRKSASVAARIEALAPSLAGDAPNPEYPWPRAAPQAAPAEYSFPIWQELQETVGGRKFLDLIARLLLAADAFL